MSPRINTDQRRLERLRVLTEVSRALTYTTSIGEVLNLAVKRAAELVDADKAVLMLMDAEGLLTVRAVHGIDEEDLAHVRAALDETLIRRLQQLLDYPSEDCFLSVPLVAQGKVTGLLGAVRADGGSAAGDDEWLLSALADQASVALENARLVELASSEQDERDRAVEAEGRVRATLSHELRSPLNAIQSYSSLLLDGVLDPLTDRQQDAIARIRMSGQHLLGVVENVMEMARIQAGVTKVARQGVRVDRIISQSIHLLQHMAARKDHRVRTMGADGAVALADPHGLRQALVNLIGNAIKYTPEGGNIDIEASIVERDGAPFVALSVTDDGPGIPPSALATIFQPYDRGVADDGGGLGLGLTISRELVRQASGDIEVRSTPGSGSTFTVVLPAYTDGTSRQTVTHRPPSSSVLSRQSLGSGSS